jgi:hypothetical protein
MKKQKERDIQRKLVFRLRAWGAEVVKLTTLGIYGKTGYPDLLVLRNGRAIFVEVKTPTGKLTPRQDATLSRLEAQGFDTFVVRDAEDSTLDRIFGE